jgi:hypothetical protein
MTCCSGLRCLYRVWTPEAVTTGCFPLLWGMSRTCDSTRGMLTCLHPTRWREPANPPSPSGPADAHTSASEKRRAAPKRLPRLCCAGLTVCRHHTTCTDREAKQYATGGNSGMQHSRFNGEGVPYCLRAGAKHKRGIYLAQGMLEIHQRDTADTAERLVQQTGIQPTTLYIFAKFSGHDTNPCRITHCSEQHRMIMCNIGSQ